MKNIAITILASAVVAGMVTLGLRSPLVYTPPPSEPLGALTGPNIPYDFLRWGLGIGVSIIPLSADIRNATGTATSYTSQPICSLQGPAATTTISLNNTAIIFTNAATGTGAKIRVFRGVNEQSTTTELFARDVLVAGGASVDGAVGSTTPLGANSTTISSLLLGPSQFVNFTIEGMPNPHGAPIGLSGTCQTVLTTAL